MDFRMVQIVWKGMSKMGRSIDNMVSELHTIDKDNKYSICYMCGRWQIRNVVTGEGIDTDVGFVDAKKWLLNDIKQNRKGE